MTLKKVYLLSYSCGPYQPLSGLGVVYTLELKVVWLGLPFLSYKEVVTEKIWHHNNTARTLANWDTLIKDKVNIN